MEGKWDIFNHLIILTVMFLMPSYQKQSAFLEYTKIYNQKDKQNDSFSLMVILLASLVKCHLVVLLSIDSLH